MAEFSGMVLGEVTITRVLTDDGDDYWIDAVDNQGNYLTRPEVNMYLSECQYGMMRHDLAAELGIDLSDED